MNLLFLIFQGGTRNFDSTSRVWTNAYCFFITTFQGCPFFFFCMTEMQPRQSLCSCHSTSHWLLTAMKLKFISEFAFKSTSTSSVSFVSRYCPLKLIYLNCLSGRNTIQWCMFSLGVAAYQNVMWSCKTRKATISKTCSDAKESKKSRICVVLKMHPRTGSIFC